MEKRLGPSCVGQLRRRGRVGQSAVDVIVERLYDREEDLL